MGSNGFRISGEKYLPTQDAVKLNQKGSQGYKEKDRLQIYDKILHFYQF